MFVFIFFWCVAFFSPLILRNTPFSMSLNRSNYIGFYWLYSVNIFVLLGVVLFYFNGLNATHSFYLTEESISHASYWAVYQVIVFFVFLKALFIFAGYLRRTYGRTHIYHDSAISGGLFLLSCNTIALLAIFFIFYLFGGKNAFFQSFIFGQDLLSARLANSNLSLPSIFLSYLRFLVTLGVVLLAAYWKSINNLYRSAHIVILIFGATFLGSKAPILQSLLLFFLSYLTFNKVKPSKGLILIPAIALVLYFSLLFILSLQYESFDLYAFFEGRVIYGQVHGFYEQFSLHLRDASYIFHAIPFANLFLDYPVYNRDLMSWTWGMNVASNEIGVMNSLFGGEALAIGGYYLLFISPFIVAASYFLLYQLLYKLFIFFAKDPFISSVLSASYILFDIYITADISGFLFFKYHVMHLIFFVPFFVVFILVNQFRRF